MEKQISQQTANTVKRKIDDTIDDLIQEQEQKVLKKRGLVIDAARNLSLLKSPIPNVCQDRPVDLIKCFSENEIGITNNDAAISLSGSQTVPFNIEQNEPLDLSKCSSSSSTPSNQHVRSMDNASTAGEKIIPFLNANSFKLCDCKSGCSLEKSLTALNKTETVVQKKYNKNKQQSKSSLSSSTITTTTSTTTTTSSLSTTTTTTTSSSSSSALMLSRNFVLKPADNTLVVTADPGASTKTIVPSNESQVGFEPGSSSSSSSSLMLSRNFVLKPADHTLVVTADPGASTKTIVPSNESQVDRVDFGQEDALSTTKKNSSGNVIQEQSTV